MDSTLQGLIRDMCSFFKIYAAGVLFQLERPSEAVLCQASPHRLDVVGESRVTGSTFLYMDLLLLTGSAKRAALLEANF